MDTDRVVARVLGVPIDALSWERAVARIMDWARASESRYVAICNVHVTVTASRDTSFGQVIDTADVATPDGAPIAWMLRRLGYTSQARISGPDLMLALLQRCLEDGVAVYFYGSTEATLAALDTRLMERFPGLLISGRESPPFRALSTDEDDAAVARINASGAGILFVGLGCPKQERWMAAHRGRVNAVMIGVGAAFDFHAGTVRRAPAWMCHNGLEWLHRLLSEPRRLWKRYLVTNTLFIAGAAWQLLQMVWSDHEHRTKSRD
ncbi:glycosyl transferase, WecB/TagA/CpsF family [Thiorhodococcus drewsii AZ1]|uniref:Glycosyl transferase, WecB/TagA/CpsF family n=1 Tax=Thiorhodococcus drewsii AZ1 TaxID=765913 RepID=G2E8B3_9GAMM|nr:WecB/TagA/CpsF family glycosyltransferase [Thiorhodococcus drewsii]EGV27652.1 glycosyl transferase, WecB/TagA/CpsF family [Thiorhodococcus drewsii AZ1]